MTLLVCSLNSVLDVTNGVLYIAVSVPDPRKGQTTVVTVLQDATGMKPDHLLLSSSAVMQVAGVMLA